MIRKWLVMFILVPSVALLSSCCKGYGLSTVSDGEFSGFGYLDDFTDESSSAEFVVESDEDEAVTIVVRGKCDSASDMDACELKSDHFSAPVVFHEYGVWSEASVEAKLVKGYNYITVECFRPTEGSIAIDYIEIQ